MTGSLQLIDRNNNSFKVYPALIKNMELTAKLMPKLINPLMLNDTKFDQYKDYEQYTTEESYEGIQELISFALREQTNVENFDIRMVKRLFLEYKAIDKSNTKDNYKSHTTIVDRNGNEHIAYSYLLRDYEEAIGLVDWIDTLVLLNNFEDETIREHAIHMVYKALNEKESKEDIRRYLDLDFLREAFNIYYDLPMDYDHVLLNDKRIEVGTTINDDHGNEHRVYSAMLEHLDTILKNLPIIHTEKPGDSYGATMELLELAFNGKYTREQLEEFLDVESVGKVMGIYMGLPLASIECR
jgi:hypothetical protein